MTAGGGSNRPTFPHSDNTERASGQFVDWIVNNTTGIAALISAAQGATSPFSGVVMTDPEAYMGTSAAGDTQFELDGFKAAIGALDAVVNIGTSVDAVVSEADASGVFDAIDIDATVATIHNNALARSTTATETIVDDALGWAGEAVAGIDEDAQAAQIHADKTDVAATLSAAATAALTEAINALSGATAVGDASAAHTAELAAIVTDITQASATALTMAGNAVAGISADTIATANHTAERASISLAINAASTDALVIATNALAGEDPTASAAAVHNTERSSINTDITQAVSTALFAANQAVANLDVTTTVAAIHDVERAEIGDLMAAAVASAVVAADSSIDSAVIDDAVDSFEDITKRTYLRSQARFAAGMSDINAVNSSAFMFGIASIENEMLQNTTKFASDVALQNYSESYRTALQGFITAFIATFTQHGTWEMEGNKYEQDAYNNTMQMFMESFNGTFNKHMDYMRDVTGLKQGTFNNTMQSDMQTFLGTFREHMDKSFEVLRFEQDDYRLNLQQFMQSFVGTFSRSMQQSLGYTNMKQENYRAGLADFMQVFGSTFGSRMNAYMQTQDLEQTDYRAIIDGNLGVLNNEFSGDLGAYAGMQTNRSNNRDGFVTGQTKSVYDRIFQEVDILKIYNQLQQEANKERVLALDHEVTGNMKIGFEDSIYDLELFKYGSNMLAASSGASVPTNKPSDLERTLESGGKIISAIGQLI